MDRLRDLEELVAALDHGPLRVDAQIAHEGDVGDEELGHAAAVGGAVDLKDARTSERLGGGAEPFHGLLAGVCGVVIQVAGGDVDRAQHGGSLPVEQRFSSDPVRVPRTQAAPSPRSVRSASVRTLSRSAAVMCWSRSMSAVRESGANGFVR